MKRYAVCKIIGDGLTPETAFRPAISDVTDPQTGFAAYNITSIIGNYPAGHPQAGQPTHDWCLVLASGDDFKLVEGNADIDLLPEVDLDVKVSAMHVPTKVEMGEKLVARGIDTSFVGNADGFREVIRQLGELQDATFDEKKFDVAE